MIVSRADVIKGTQGGQQAALRLHYTLKLSHRNSRDRGLMTDIPTGDL